MTSWKSLTWLTTRLERLRRARAEMSFIYPVRSLAGESLWYLIHAAHTVKVVAAPATRPAHRLAKTAIRSVFAAHSAALLESHEHLDGMMLVMAWFRKYPKELKKTLTVGEALGKCKCGRDD